MSTRTLLIVILLLSITNTAIADESRIGVILPLTGGAASNGVSIRNSIMMADSKFDAKNQVSFVFEDDQMKPRNTVTATRRLIADGINGLIVFGSPTSLAVNGIAETEKIPMVGMSVVDRVVKDKTFVVKHWVTAEAETKTLTKEIRSLGYKKIAIVSTTNDAMLKLKELFLAETTAEVVLDEEYQPEDLDFRSTASKIKQLNPDAVYILLWAPQPGVFSKQLRKIGYQGALFGAHNIEDPNEVSASEGALHGAWYVTGDDSAGETYYKNYKRKFGTSPSNGGINAYDIAKMMIEGLNSGDLNSFLHNTKDFKGAYGKYSATGSGDFTIPATIKKITPEGFVFAQ